MEMNEGPSSGGFEDEPPGSPKRKKVRAKYASKACVSCRRSKLKCSGENPCRRCMDNGRRCFYSEDQTAAEALQNLSRPSVPQPSSASIAGNGYTGNGTIRNILPRSEPMPRRSSDASSLGTSMDARMARIEGMMEALLHDRGIAITPRGSTEREAPPVGEYHIQEDAINPNLAPVRVHPAYVVDQRQLQTRPSTSASHSIPVVQGANSVDAPFVLPNEYGRYLDQFFEEVHPFYPCLDPIAFREQSSSMLSSLPIRQDRRMLLALHYIVFALVDVSENTSSKETRSGWHWYQSAEDLIGQEVLHGPVNLALLLFVILKAVYLTYIDKPNTSYITIGLACRICFRMGLHDNRRWRRLFGDDIERPQRIFWTLYYVDRRISLSCGRPYGIRDSDIHVEEPMVGYSPDSGRLLTWMIMFAKEAGNLWENRSCLTSSTESTVLAATEPLASWMGPLEDRLKGCLKEHRNGSVTLQEVENLALTLLLVSNLRLLYHRHRVLFLSCSEDTVDDSVSTCRAIVHTSNIFLTALGRATLGLLRYHIASSLGSVILTMCILRGVRNHSVVPPAEEWDRLIQGSITLLQRLGTTNPLARRIKDDLNGSVIGAPHINPNQCPYRHLDFMEQVKEESFEHREGEDGELELSMESNRGKYGVPWL